MRRPNAGMGQSPRPEISMTELAEQASRVTDANRSIFADHFIAMMGGCGENPDDVWFDAYTRFDVPDLKKRFLKLARIELATAEDVEAGSAEFETTFVDDKGERFDGETCRSTMSEDVKTGIVFHDRGQTWFYGTDSAAGGAPRLTPLADQIPAGLSAALGERALTDVLPLEGEVHISRSGLLTRISPADLAEPQYSEELFLKARGEARAVRAREDAIAAIFDGVVTPERLAPLGEGFDLPISKKALGKHRRETIYQANETIFTELSAALMEAYRGAGYLKPIPNGRGRGIREVDAWNAWLAGEDLEAEWWMKSALRRTPAFSLLQQAFNSASVKLEMAKERALSPSGDVDPSGRLDFEVTAEDIAEETSQARIEARNAFMAEDLNDLRGQLEGHTCNVTGERLRMMGDLFAPVLGTYDKNYRLQPVPNIEVPKVARHLTINLPSGELVIADWFRIPGFTAAMNLLSGEQEGGFDINGGKGLDDRQRAYLEKAGIVIVQVGNSSPAAYEDTPGVFRMGQVYEDDDRFWDEDGNRTEVALPEETFRTCTDLWANTLADRARVVDVLMFSGRYEEREDAEKALTDYIEDAYGAHSVKIDAQELHLYLPTGAAHRSEGFENTFRVAGLEYGDWRHDQYLISTRPLEVDPALIEPCDWKEGGPDPEHRMFGTDPEIEEDNAVEP